MRFIPSSSTTSKRRCQLFEIAQPAHFRSCFALTTADIWKQAITNHWRARPYWSWVYFRRIKTRHQTRRIVKHPEYLSVPCLQSNIEWYLKWGECITSLIVRQID
jgi:hypothetical protein